MISAGSLPTLNWPMFRILQECLTNIHRHSGGKTATIRLSRSSESVALEIQDNGNGIPPEKLDGIHAQRSGVGIPGCESVFVISKAMDIHSSGRARKSRSPCRFR